MCENPYKPEPHRILQVTRQTDIEYTFRVESQARPVFGQFFEVSIPRVGEAPISVSGVGDGWLEFTIRSVGSLTGGVHEKRAGDMLFLRGPYGNGFPLDEFKGQHLVVAAGGCGLSPVRPLLDYCFHHPEAVGQLDILLGFKTAGDILFREDIQRWKTKFNTILTVDKTCGCWDGECVGLITQYAKDIKLSEFPRMEIVIVGPPIMMKFTAEEFMNRGVPAERILVSMERKMSCGLGKCGHCKINDTYVCSDGPVYRYNKAIQLVD